MTNETAALAAPSAPAAASLNVDDDASAVSDDPAFDRLFGRDADGAPLWLRTEELLRIDDGENVDDDDNVGDVDADAADNENGENKSEGAAAGDGKKKSKDAFDAEAYIAEAKKLVRGKEVEVSTPRERNGAERQIESID